SLDLIEKGIHPLRIATGFEKACEVAVKRVEEISKIVDILADDQTALKKAATTALGSKVVSSRKDQLAKISVDAVLA
ncbi:cct5, partial [Symbiodinium sp. CCMP2456]